MFVWWCALIILAALSSMWATRRWLIPAEQLRQRQELEKALRISQQQYRSIFEDQPEMILRFTRDGIVTFANRAYCDRYGMTPEDAIGSNCFLNIHPDYRQAAMSIIQTTTSEQPQARTLIKVQRPDGSQDWAEWNGRALYDVDGTHLGYQAIGRIVTKLVQAEDELRKKESLLRHAARLSTLGEMVAVITHELRQPLYSISNFAFACQQQLSEADGDEVSGKLKSWNLDIIDQVERANRIIARLRGFARRSDSIVSSVSINDVARESAAVMQFELNVASITLVQELDATIPESPMDRLQMEQVLINLIRNAYEALASAPALNPTITLRTRLLGDAIEVAVLDNGPGLPESELESVFQPFSTTKNEGLGLGLAICRSIIEEHDGHIVARPNHPGLQVVFTIPLELRGTFAS